MCALKAYIQIWGLYQTIEFLRENWRSQGHLINQEAEDVAPHPAESKLLRTSSRPAGGAGASVHRRSKKHLSTTMLCSLSVELHHIKIKVHEAKPILPSRDSKIKQNK